MGIFLSLLISSDFCSVGKCPGRCTISHDCYGGLHLGFLFYLSLACFLWLSYCSLCFCTRLLCPRLPQIMDCGLAYQLQVISCCSRCSCVRGGLAAEICLAIDRQTEGSINDVVIRVAHLLWAGAGIWGAHHQLGRTHLANMYGSFGNTLSKRRKHCLLHAN